MLSSRLKLRLDRDVLLSRMRRFSMLKVILLGEL
jgi:hypothetical protein